MSFCFYFFLIKLDLKVGVHFSKGLRIMAQPGPNNLETQHPDGLVTERIPVLVLLFDSLSISFLLNFRLFLDGPPITLPKTSI
jgi:hypothetical protein